MSNNVMTTKSLSKYEDAVMTQLDTNPLANAAALKVVVDAIDDAAIINRYTQMADFLKATVALTKGTHGGVVSLDTLTSGGTDYVVDQDLPISESGSDGVGASATVATITEGTGEILTINVVGGKGYDTPVLDLTAGTIDAEITLQATAYGAYDEPQLIDDMLALV